LCPFVYKFKSRHKGDTMSIWLDLHGEDYTFLDTIAEQDRRYGPCEDDSESKFPYVNILPDESETEGGSPLKF
jgi:hypothetical protein